MHHFLVYLGWAIGCNISGQPNNKSIEMNEMSPNGGKGGMNQSSNWGIESPNSKQTKSLSKIINKTNLNRDKVTELTKTSN